MGPRVPVTAHRAPVEATALARTPLPDRAFGDDVAP